MRICIVLICSPRNVRLVISFVNKSTWSQKTYPSVWRRPRPRPFQAFFLSSITWCFDDWRPWSCEYEISHWWSRWIRKKSDGCGFMMICAMHRYIFQFQLFVWLKAKIFTSNTYKLDDYFFCKVEISSSSVC